MIYMNECRECGRTWACTKVKDRCLRCTEKAGEVYA